MRLNIMKELFRRVRESNEPATRYHLLWNDELRPKGFKETTILMCVFNICGYAWIDPSIENLILQIAVGTIVIGLSYIVLWHYWNGKNWARSLVLITSIIALLNLIDFMDLNMLQKIIAIGEAALACYLLYWLNTKEVESYFKVSPKIKSNP